MARHADEDRMPTRDPPPPVITVSPVSEPAPSPAPAAGVAARVARNTAIRAGAELLAKFASLLLLAVLARTEGTGKLGAFVLAIAWTEIAATPIDMGFDRHFLRLVARDRTQLDHALYNVLLLKARRAGPCVVVSLAVALIAGLSPTILTLIALLTVASLFDAVVLTLTAAFNGLERADLVGRILLAQRLVSGGVGSVVLLLGGGVIGVGITFAFASMVAVAEGTRLFVRHVGRPAWAVPPGPRAELRRNSLPFAAQEVLSSGLARLDALLLFVLATQTVVGLYGAAYRLLEATLFISIALLGSFAAMFTYLDEHSEPTINDVFARALKLCVALLAPCAVALGTLPAPILRLLFGPRFAEAQDALRLLAPTVLVLGLVLMGTSLIASRLNPRLLLNAFIVAFVVNLAANLALIPPYGAAGAAGAMLICEVVLCFIVLRHSVRAVGTPRLGPTAGAAGAGCAAMAGVLLLVESLAGVLPALVAGSLAYGVVFALVERRVAPKDFAVIRDLVLGRLRPARAAGAA